MKCAQPTRIKLGMLLFILIAVLLLRINVSIATSMISLDKATLASSSQKADYDPANAMDDNPSTRWGSGYSDDEWIYIDLGSTATIAKVILDWETAYGAEYEIQASDDSSSWATIYTESDGDGE